MKDSAGSQGRVHAVEQRFEPGNVVHSGMRKNEIDVALPKPVAFQISHFVFGGLNPAAAASARALLIASLVKSYGSGRLSRQRPIRPRLGGYGHGQPRYLDPQKRRVLKQYRPSDSRSTMAYRGC